MFHQLHLVPFSVVGGGRWNKSAGFICANFLFIKWKVNWNVINTWIIQVDWCFCRVNLKGKISHVLQPLDEFINSTGPLTWFFSLSLSLLFCWFNRKNLLTRKPFIPVLTIVSLDLASCSFYLEQKFTLLLFCLLLGGWRQDFHLCPIKGSLNWVTIELGPKGLQVEATLQTLSPTLFLFFPFSLSFTHCNARVTKYLETTRTERERERERVT